MRRLVPVLPSCVLSVLFVTAASALPVGFTDSVVHFGFAEPVAMIFAPDGRMIIGERGGLVRVIQNGVVLGTPALSLPVETYEEQGLLGLELHPDFPDSNWLYVCYTRYTGRDNENFNLVSRFRLNGNIANPASEQVLLDDIPTGLGRHVAGDIHFAPDGNLFIATGENGWGEAYPLQDWRLEGKMLRIRPWGGPAPGNPLIGVAGAREEIWQKGLRNPFRFAVNPSSGAPYICDVGEISYEEINASGPNANFGFPTYEGPAVPDPPWHHGPWYYYARGSGAALTGATFYTGSVFPPQYWRNLFFMDHVRGEIGRIVLNPSGSIQSATFPWGTTSVAGWLTGPIALVCGPDGALWYNTYDPGDIHRISYRPTTGVEPALRSFDLAPAFPNPFRESVTLVFSIGSAGRARLGLFDLSGRIVRTIADGDFPPGPHSAQWDGRDQHGDVVKAGVYFARLETAAGEFRRRVARAR